ncbi:MAG: Sec-independent protein translocase protein TatB [Alphaproteobacteria bacterium]|nr:Sec-independent protein translocase protein TatB [Alphaproteobacteria bacterium]
MLDIGWTEMIVVVLVLILVVGPKDLPRVVRTVGQWTAKARRMSREFTSSLEEIGRETEINDLRRDLNSIGGGGAVTSLENHIDPDGSLKKSVQADYAAGNAGSTYTALGTPADVDSDAGKPAEIPSEGDAVAAAAAKADTVTTDTSETTEPPAKAGASSA